MSENEIFPEGRAGLYTESDGNASFAASASRSRERARVKYREIYAEGKYRRFMMMSRRVSSSRVKNILKIFFLHDESHSVSLSSTPESLTDYDWETKKTHFRFVCMTSYQSHS